MEIQRLKSEIIANIRSSCTINNVTQCVAELVLNSLDSKSTSIAVRVNLITFKIQVVDNGEGITKTNLELVGLRYMTNKCNNLVQLQKHIKYHGFRGEALASIIDMSKKVNITSKHINSTETYAKNFSKHKDNQIACVKNRPSFGTTVTVEGFLYNLPIRRNRIVPELELEDIKRNIESLVIMYPNVSFSVRNDLSGNLIINSQKNKDIISAFKYLHPKIDEEFSVMKVSKDKVTVEALLFKGLFANKHLQYVYVNKRPVHCPKIQKFVSNLFFKNKNFDKKKSLNSKIVNDKNKHPIYVINVKCPHSHVDILLNPSKTLVEFKNWTMVLQCLEKLVYSFFGNRKKLTTNNKYLPVREEFKSSGGVSQIYGAFRSYGYKRKQSDENLVQKKMQKVCSEDSMVIEESDFGAEDGEVAIIKTVQPKSDFIREGPIVDENFASSRKQINKHEKSTKDDRNPNKVSTENEEKNSLSSDESHNSVSQEFEKLPVDKIETYETNNQSVSDDIYNISDTTLAKKPKVKVFKKPLPIKIEHKNIGTGNLRNLRGPSKIIAKSMNVSPYIVESKRCKPILKQIVPKKLDEERSTLSKFTADENKGKDLIMDMFLKSTQVYSTEEDNQSGTRSDETILEVESNFLLENNIQTKINGLSKTMSMSVNIRSTKKIKKQKSKVHRTEKIDRVSKCVQTSLNDNKMVSKCVQTTVDQNCLKSKSNLRCENFSDILVGKKPSENYTVVLSEGVHPKETPRFRFIYRKPSCFDPEPINKFTSSNNCKCNCHLNASKIFHFVGSVYKKNKKQAGNILNNNFDVFGSGCDLNEIDVSSIEKPHDSKIENYENIKHNAKNPTQAEINQFVQKFLQQQQFPNVMFRDYEPVKLRKDGKTEYYEDIKHIVRNPTQAEMKRCIKNYDQHKQQLHNVLYRNYEPMKHHGDGKAENYKGVKQREEIPMQAEIKECRQNYGQHKQANNILYREYEPVTRNIPNIFQKPYQAKFLTRQKKSNTNLHGMFGFDRSPYFVPPQNALYLNKIYENRLNKVNLAPYSVKDNMVPNKADSYILFNPQYRSTQMKDYNNRICENRFNKFNLTPYPLKDRDFLNLVPHNVDSYILFDPQYRSTQLRDLNKDDALNLKICGGRVTDDSLQAENFPETDFTIDHFGNFRPAYKSTQRDRMKCTSVEGFQLENNVHTSFAECNENSFNSQLNLINVSEDVCGNLNPFHHMIDNFQSSCKNTQGNFDRMEKLGLQKELEHKTLIFGEFKNQNNSNAYIDLNPTHQAVQRNISPKNVEINQKPSPKGTGLDGHSDEPLIITLSNQEKQDLLRKELDAERDLNAKQYLEWDSLSEIPKLQEDIQPSVYQELGKEWVKKRNNFGSSFYINKRTGFTTFVTPKLDGNQFKFGKRFEFMPKGSSPILKEVKRVDRSLNQNDKKKLQGYILESHQNELLIVKWQNYIKHNDPKTFFDEVYKEKLKLFEDCLPKINAFDRKKHVSELHGAMHFDKTLFDNIDVIGQVDGKFISVIEKTKDLLILFDQHAVHERIRLEELLKVYTNAKMKWLEKLVFLFPQNDLSLLKKHELYLSFLGLSVEFFVNGINILEIPLCIYNKFKDNDDQHSLREVIKLLINEIIDLLKETRGVSFGNLPRLIQNVINLEACRGAIKFGDNLSKKDCMDLLGRLAVCKLPFQCAHGRPTLTPLVRLNLTQKCVPYKINLKKTIGILGAQSITK